MLTSQQQHWKLRLLKFNAKLFIPWNAIFIQMIVCMNEIKTLSDIKCHKIFTSKAPFLGLHQEEAVKWKDASNRTQEFVHSR